MKQSQFLYLGLLLRLVAGLAAVFGPAVLVIRQSLSWDSLVFGVILVGTVSALSLGPITLSWRHLVGLSYVTFALMWPAIYAPEIVAETASGRLSFCSWWQRLEPSRWRFTASTSREVVAISPSSRTSSQ